MSDHDSSAYKIPYDLRPSKQAERYIMVEILRGLQKLGLSIESYHYVGFGSYFFHDYRILHHELNLSEMTSIEGDMTILKRCEFNKPYSAITIVPKMSSDYLPALSRIETYLVWLDNDFGLTKIVTDDISTCFARLRVGSVFFLTIDMELPDEITNATVDKVFEHYRDELQGEVSRGFTVSDFAASKFDETVRKIIARATEIGLRGRTDVNYLNLLSLYYKDSNRMYTMGGVFCDADLRKKIKESSLMAHEFIRENFAADSIEIPRIILTKKERLFLERYCLGAEKYDGSIGVAGDLAEIYKRYYRYLPNFAEIL
jgi:hypothetical protein